MSAKPLAAAARGIDANASITPLSAQALYEHGYEFVVRYVGRVSQTATDLTVAEADIIHTAGLGLMVVQHVESETSWTPSDAKGTLYGTTAARRCVSLGIEPGTSVWCDLEGVADGTPEESVIDFCNSWFTSVQSAGFLPGLYVGWHCGLGPDDLYKRLKFAAFWASYNLNTDEYPAVRGVQMRQRAAKPGDIPSGVGFPLDVNLVTGDLLGAFPIMDVV